MEATIPPAGPMIFPIVTVLDQKVLLKYELNWAERSEIYWETRLNIKTICGEKLYFIHYVQFQCFFLRKQKFQYASIFLLSFQSARQAFVEVLSKTV